MTQTTAVPAAVEHTLPSAVLVDGVPVRYGTSGGGDRDLVLVHGNGAHHLWWHRVVPALDPRWRITRVDLSGHGDSGHRDAYSAQTWAAELLAVLDAIGAPAAVVAGHSMGGAVALTLAAAHPDRVTGLVLLDTGVRPPYRYRGYLGQPLPVRPGGPRPPDATREQLLARFRLMPPQPHPADDVLGPVATHSARRTPEGWTWKHDRRGLATISDAHVDGCLRQVRCPVAYAYGTRSEITDQESAEHLASRVPGGAHVVPLEGAHHHVVLERPEECAALIDEMVTLAPSR